MVEDGVLRASGGVSHQPAIATRARHGEDFPLADVMTENIRRQYSIRFTAHHIQRPFPGHFPAAGRCVDYRYQRWEDEGAKLP